MEKAPKQLRKAGRELWKAMLDTYEFTAAEESLLVMACTAADDCEKTRAVLEREGFTVTAPGGKLVQHPCCLTLRDARNFIAKVMRQLEPKRASQHQPRPHSWGLGVAGR
jgi:phage terminase small subunit